MKKGDPLLMSLNNFQTKKSPHFTRELLRSKDRQNNHRLHRFPSIIPHHKHFVNALSLLALLLSLVSCVFYLPRASFAASECDLSKSDLAFYAKNNILYYCPQKDHSTSGLAGGDCIISASLSDNVSTVLSALLEHGYNKTAAAAIIGALMGESGTGLSNSVIEGGSHASSNFRLWTSSGRVLPANTGFGIAQWTNDARQRALQAYADSVGESVTSLEVQVQFLLQEIYLKDGTITSGYDVTPAHMNTLSLEEAVTHWVRGFERAGIESLSTRTSRAEQVLGGYLTVCDATVSAGETPPDVTVELDPGETTGNIRQTITTDSGKTDTTWYNITRPD